MTNILFLCTANIQRSRTAETLFKGLYPGLNFKSAGLSKKECERNNSTLCTIELLTWADQIYVFEQLHLARIGEHSGGQFDSKITNLNVPDRYQFMQQELIDLLKSKGLDFVAKG